MSDEKRTFRIDIKKDFLDKIEEQFCYAEVMGEKVKVRSLSSVCTEAVLSGILIMIDELAAIRKHFGKNVYLKAGGIGFAERSLDESGANEEPSELVPEPEHPL